MKNTVLRSIINNTFLPNYTIIRDYFQENNIVNNGLYAIDGGFTLRFCINDTKRLFERNLKIQPDDWYYRTHSVKYTLNSLGYRTREFDDIDWKESIVMFGCSHIFGTGVTNEHTIPYFLEQLSGRSVINMGIPASSIQTVLHNSIILNDSKYPTPKAVVNMWTELTRYQCYQNDYVLNEGYWSLDDRRHNFFDVQNMALLNLMNIKMIRNLWKNKTIYKEFSGFIFPQRPGTRSGTDLIMKLDSKFNLKYPQTLIPFVTDSSEFAGLNDVPYRARDLDPSNNAAHFGYKFNKKIAEILFENIKPQLDNS